jgi:signal peptidase I
MMPSLTDQERIFINKFTYRFGIGNIERGDMVVFWFPLDKTKSYIKRVIGLPGDNIEINSGVVMVNGQRLREDYVPDEYRRRNSYPETEVLAYHHVLGDHRSSSNDSRAWGTVERNYIYGKAVFVYWPWRRWACQVAIQLYLRRIVGLLIHWSRQHGVGFRVVDVPISTDQSQHGQGDSWYSPYANSADITPSATSPCRSSLRRLFTASRKFCM